MNTTTDGGPWPRLRRLALQGASAVAFLLVFEAGARFVGERLPERNARRDSAFKSAALDLLEFTKDPAVRPDPYLGFAGTSPLFVKTVRDGREWYETAPNKIGTYRKESFNLQKQPGAFRIFCIGGSSVASAGMPAEGTFPGLLKTGLAGIVGSANVEVVNAGGGGTGSYQYREIAREVRNLGADLIVIYPEAGERKYLPPQPEGELADRDSDSPARAEARRWLVKSRLYIGIRDLIEGLRPKYAKTSANVTFSYAAIDAARRTFSHETFTRVFDFKKDRVPPAMPPALEYDKIARAHAHFVDNLTKIVEEARAAGVPVLLVDTVRNLKHDFYLRFHVEPRDVDPARAEEWQKYYKSGIEAKKAGKYEEAIADLMKARECYRVDRDEILNLYIGQCLEALGRFERAREEYERSFLKHPLKLKLKEVAAKTGAPIVDPYGAVCRQSPNGIPDATMFMDSFHPMPVTNRIIAEEILQFIIESGAVARFPKAGAAVVGAAKQQMRTAASAVDIYTDRKMQIAIYQKEFAKALEIAKNIDGGKNFLTLMYLGYAHSKMGNWDAARATYQELKGQVLGPRENPGVAIPSLDRDADVVRLLFDSDLFSEF